MTLAERLPELEKVRELLAQKGFDLEKQHEQECNAILKSNYKSYAVLQIRRIQAFMPYCDNKARAQKTIEYFKGWK